MIDGQKRVIIAGISPEIDGGLHPISRVVGEEVRVEADVFTDGHDIIACELLYKHDSEKNWNAVPMKALINDRWTASFKVSLQGHYAYTIKGWVDHGLTWQSELERKFNGNQHVSVELKDGINLLKDLNGKLDKTEKALVKEASKLFKEADKNYHDAVKMALGSDIKALFQKYPDTKFATICEKELGVYVDRIKARFSAWYEFFPRSTSEIMGQHGTFKDCERILPRIAGLGFDTIYLPPIHPIGIQHRKGKNNAVTAMEGEPGSPWAIGASDGGHKDVLKDLGTIEDFRNFVSEAEKVGIEVALDFALQCSPDHPYVKEHPQWFKWRSDGTVQYAENPPKKYQDVLPFYFETDDWENLWIELKSILLYWIEQGVKIFRVDNPHTKPFRFWKWLIAEIKLQYPEVLFLSEAFTRPTIMYQLAKIGFTQSYTYFSWRNSKAELVEYMNELTKDEPKEFFRPNFWPNTPDINPYILQTGKESQFITRYVLAATLSSNYGLYGPVYDFIIHQPIAGKEEYADSEKYEIYNWDWKHNNKMMDVMRTVNFARKREEALQETNNLVICNNDHGEILAYYKSNADKSSEILVVVNFSSTHKVSSWIQLPLKEMGIPAGSPVMMVDLFTNAEYRWQNEWNYVELDPHVLPFHLFKIKRG